MFGGQSTFGAGTSGFGNTAAASGFGSSPFGQQQQQQPAFGQAQQPAFGAAPQAAGGSAFGQQNAFGTSTVGSSPFGGGGGGAFGSQPQAGSTFGAQPSASPFGGSAGGGSAFGAQPSSTPAFGAAAASSSPFGSGGGAFGSQGVTPFGQQAQAQAQPSAFGGGMGQTPFGGGQQQGVGAFGGAAGGGAFGGAGAQQGTGTDYQATRDSSDPAKTIDYVSICAMDKYRGKSQEELRWEDYQAGRTGPSGAGGAFGTQGGAFGAQGGAFGGGGGGAFGAAGGGGGVFGGASGGGAFGAQSQPAFGQPQSSSPFGTPSSAFGAGATTSSAFGAGGGGAFGAKPAGTTFGAAGSAFGQPQQQQQQQQGGGFGFGQSQPQQQTSVFGQPQQQQQQPFGATTTSSPFGAQQGQQQGAFGAASGGFGTPQQGGGSTFGAARGSLFGGGQQQPQQQQSGGLFGTPASAASSGGGFLFGSSPQQTSTAFGANTAAAGAFGTNKPLFGGTSTPAASSGGGFSFGAATSQPASGGLFGGGATQASGGLFGAGAATSSPGFGLGAQQSAAGASFGSTWQQNSGTAFSFGSKPAASTPGGGLFGAQQPAASPGAGGGFGFGTPGGTPAQPGQGATPQQAPATPTLTSSPYGALAEPPRLSTDERLQRSMRRGLSRLQAGVKAMLPARSITPRMGAVPASPGLLMSPAMSAGGALPATPLSGASSRQPPSSGLPSASRTPSALVPRTPMSAQPPSTSSGLRGSIVGHSELTVRKPPKRVERPERRGAGGRGGSAGEGGGGGAQADGGGAGPSGSPAAWASGAQNARQNGAAAAGGRAPRDGQDAAPLPRLRRPGYSYSPPEEELLERWRADAGSLAAVENFEVRHERLGSVRWLRPVDVRGLDIDRIVTFLDREVRVYEDEREAPPRGEGLNKPAEVTLFGVFKMDKATGEPTTDPKRRMKYADTIAKTTASMGATLVSYDPQEGVWVFRTEHFSRYGVADDSDDEDEDAERAGAEQDGRGAANGVERPGGGADLRAGVVAGNEAAAAAAWEHDDDAMEASLAGGDSVAGSEGEWGADRAVAGGRGGALFREGGVAVPAAAAPPAAPGGCSWITPRGDAMRAVRPSRGPPSSSPVALAPGSRQGRDAAPAALPETIGPSAMVDAGAFMGRSTRVGWAAGSRLAFAGGLTCGYAGVGPASAREQRGGTRVSCVTAASAFADQGVEAAQARVVAQLRAHRRFVAVDGGASRPRLRLSARADAPPTHALRALCGRLRAALEDPVPGETPPGALLDFPRDVDDDAAGDEGEGDDVAMAGPGASPRQRRARARAAWPLEGQRVQALWEQALAWALVVELFEEVEGEDEGAGDDEDGGVAYRYQRQWAAAWRRARVAELLSRACEPAARADCHLTLEDSRKTPNRVFLLLSARLRAEAAGAAAAAGDPRLGALVAGAGVARRAARDVGAQLDAWAAERPHGILDGRQPESRARRRVYTLVSGRVSEALRRFKEEDPGPDLPPLDWRRALGLHFWYGAGPAAALGDAIQAYEADVVGGVAPRPVPLYRERDALFYGDDSAVRRMENATTYELLRLRTGQGVAGALASGGASFWAKLLRPQGHTPDALDLSCAWLLASVLGAIGRIGSGAESPPEALWAATGLVDQLCADARTSHWALYVAAQLPDDHAASPGLRARFVEDVVLRFAPCWEEGGEAEALALDVLGPAGGAALLAYARAVHMGVEGACGSDDDDAERRVRLLLRAGRAGEALEELLGGAAPPAAVWLLGGDHARLRQVLEELPEGAGDARWQRLVGTLGAYCRLAAASMQAGGLRRAAEGREGEAREVLARLLSGLAEGGGGASATRRAMLAAMARSAAQWAQDLAQDAEPVRASAEAYGDVLGLGGCLAQDTAADQVCCAAARLLEAIAAT